MPSQPAQDTSSGVVVWGNLSLSSLTGVLEFHAAENAFRWDGDVWTIIFAGRVVHLPNRVGLGHLQVLLSNPHLDVSTAELIQTSVGKRARPRGEGTSLSPCEIEESNLSVTPLEHAGPILDEQARRQYRQRLAELHAQREDADANRDLARKESIERELEAIDRELSTATDIRGHDRGALNEREKRRKAVSNSISTAVRAIARKNPELAAHLRRSIGTGNTCKYNPREEITWST